MLLASLFSVVSRPHFFLSPIFLLSLRPMNDNLFRTLRPWFYPHSHQPFYFCAQLIFPHIRHDYIIFLQFSIFSSSTSRWVLALLVVALWVIWVECFSPSHASLLNPIFELVPRFGPSNLIGVLTISKSKFLTHSRTPVNRELAQVESPEWF